uniref:Uncharacterized protein n=1 Tax=Anguilla anguilla TaxID=7936 RepID=A0A0E9XT49_ANGAN
MLTTLLEYWSISLTVCPVPASSRWASPL